MPSEDFAIFTNEGNTTSVVLQAHFLAIEALLRPWLKTEMNESLTRNGLTALPASATIEGCAGEMVRWPVRMLEEQQKRFREHR